MGTLKSELFFADYPVGQSEDIVDFHVEDSEPFAAEDYGSLGMLAESLTYLAACYENSDNVDVPCFGWTGIFPCCQFAFDHCLL